HVNRPRLGMNRDHVGVLHRQFADLLAAFVKDCHAILLAVADIDVTRKIDRDTMDRPEGAGSFATRLRPRPIGSFRKAGEGTHFAFGAVQLLSPARARWQIGGGPFPWKRAAQVQVLAVGRDAVKLGAGMVAQGLARIVRPTPHAGDKRLSRYGAPEIEP